MAHLETYSAKGYYGYDIDNNIDPYTTHQNWQCGSCFYECTDLEWCVGAKFTYGVVPGLGYCNLYDVDLHPFMSPSLSTILYVATFNKTVGARRSRRLDLPSRSSRHDSGGSSDSGGERPRPASKAEGPATDEDGDEKDTSSFNWWNRVETQHVEGALYPYRTPPGLDVATAAGSMAMALSLSNLSSGGGSPNSHVGHNATLMRVCSAEVLNCTMGDRFASVYEVDIHHIPHSYDMQDDFGTGVWLLSVTIEPIVHSIVVDMLFCLSEELCAANCVGCPPQARPASYADAEAVLRQVEAELGGDGDHSRDTMRCVGDVECLRDVADAVARKMGAAASLPVSETVDVIAACNARLTDGMVELYSANLPGNRFNETIAGTLRSSREHRRCIASRNLTVAPCFQQTNVHRRRLQEEEEDEPVEVGSSKEVREAARRLQAMADAPLDVVQMRTLSNLTCGAIDENNITKVLALKHMAIVQWTRLAAGGNSKSRPSEMYCWDCERDTPLSCRVFFSLLVRRLQVMKESRRRRSDETHEERRRVLYEHVKKQGRQLCCARHHDTGTVECDPKHCASAVFNTISKRAGHVGRRLREQDHSLSKKHFTHVGHDMGFDVLHREGHPEERCRLHNRTEHHSMTDSECMARSMVYHLGKKHGLSPDTILKKVEQTGIELGEGMQRMTKYMGGFTDKRGLKSAPTRRGAPHSTKDRAAARTEASKLANRLLKESNIDRRPANGGAGRRLSGEDDDRPATSGRLQAVVAAHGWRDLTKGSEAVGDAMKEIDRKMTMHHTQAEKRHRRRALRSVPLPDSHSMTGAVTEAISRSSPGYVWMALQSSTGSFMRRFGQGFEEIEKLRSTHSQRYKDAVDANLLKRNDVRRRMQAVKDSVAFTASELYDRLEEDQRKRHEHIARHGGSISHALELPEKHALSWVHDVFDVGGLFEEGARLVDIEARRHDMRVKGHRQSSIVESAPSGYERLDHPHYQPTMVGDAIRRLGHRMLHGTDPEWHRAEWFRPGRRRLEANAQQGHVRMLSEAFLAGTLEAPFAFYDIVLPVGSTVKASEDSYFEAFLRYAVYGTIGCYFTKPSVVVVETQAATHEEGQPNLQRDNTETTVLKPSPEKMW